MGATAKKQVSGYKTRKVRRQEAREQKKQSKQGFVQKRKEFQSKKGRKQIKTEKRQRRRKSQPQVQPELSAASEEDEEIESEYEDPMKESRARHEEKLRAYKDGLREQRVKQMVEANEEDDQIIHKYEKLLKLNRRKGKSPLSTAFNDGLDYLLELCEDGDDIKMDKAESSDEDEGEKRVREADSDDSDFDILDSDDAGDEDLAEMFKHKKTNKRKDETDVKSKKKQKKTEDDELAELFKNKKSSKIDDDDAELAALFKNKKSHKLDDDDDELAALFKNKKSNKINDDDDDDDELAELFKTKKTKKEKPTEDIYGRPIDAEGKASKYVPPAMRAKPVTIDAKHQEQLNRLKRQLKGQLNRLAESNMHKISTEIESLYMQNPRNDMNTTLASLITDSLVSPVLAKERMVLEHMLLIAILHANIGSEISAFFLEQMITKYDELMGTIGGQDVQDKRLDNYIFILAHMYSFKLFQHTLMFDVLNRLTENFCEKAVECILLVLKSIGFTLRKDDPLALKEFINNVHKRVNDAPEEQENIRVKFMLETLLAIKNNNMTKIPQYDPSLCEHFRKLLKGLITAGKYVTSLNITMNDLLNADKRGKWWLVGSAWMGGGGLADPDQKPNSNQAVSTGEFSSKLLELARKQRMNTDDRRNVFCVIMSAEDYRDAYDKIIRLSIKDQRVIVAVVLHCCMSERSFNPYYAVLAQNFIDNDRKYFLAFQFLLWDKIRDIGELSVRQRMNMGSFMLHLLKDGGLALSVLKVIEFAQLDKKTHKLVKQIMLGLLLASDEVFSSAFNRISQSPKLSSFRDSLKLFLHVFLLRNEKVEEKLKPEECELIRQRIKMVDELIGNRSSFVKF